MTWVRIDDKLTTHPKWLALSGPSKLWWLHAAVWCGAHNNDGIVPEHAWPLVSFTAGVSMGELPAILDQLTRKPQALPSDDGKPNALMSRVPKARGGGVQFHDWQQHQPTKKQVRKKAEVSAAKAEMERLHDWLHKSAPGKKVKAIVAARDGRVCCYCDEGPLRIDGDRKGSTRLTFDLIDPASKDQWEWESVEGEPRPMLRVSELIAVSDLWCVACGYCNAAKGKRAPDETDGYRILTGRGPQNPSRSTAIQSVLGRLVGSDLAGSGQVGSVAPLSGGSSSGVNPSVGVPWSDAEVDGYPQYPADDEGVS